MTIQLLLFLIIILKSAWCAAPVPVNMFVVRHIGQGQWVSHVTTSHCLHYDFGGENQFYKKISSSLVNDCSNKINELYLSHYDYDHYSFYNLIIKKLNFVCWAYKANNSHFEVSIPYCSTLLNSLLVYTNYSHKIKNASSAVFLQDSILIPGDSPASEEIKWIPRIKKPVSVLILGHHGSKTSTSTKLLKSLPHLKMAISSSRYKKYGHPHKSVVDRLKERKIPLLKTEDWGSIYLHLI